MLHHVVAFRKQRDAIPKNCDPVLKKVIEQCLHHEPERRPTAAEIVKFITENSSLDADIADPNSKHKIPPVEDYFYDHDHFYVDEPPTDLEKNKVASLASSSYSTSTSSSSSAMSSLFSTKAYNVSRYDNSSDSLVDSSSYSDASDSDNSQQNTQNSALVNLPSVEIAKLSKSTLILFSHRKKDTDIPVKHLSLSNNM
jgi:serine/threonine protein kinase